ncbi:histidine phosphatase family protein [bacterium 210820-DFI.6.37]|nr:histidine phosphatase family protein [bacterium 210820-DFI.6.37]
MRSQIHLIRHGITEGNQKRYYYGAADIPLAPEGVEQLKELVRQDVYPRAEGADFYTTGKKRTEQTLRLIYGERDHERLPELTEMDFGQFEMKSYEQLKELPEYQKWISDKTGQAEPPGGESILGFQKRIQAGLKLLVGKHRLKELSVRHCGDDAVSILVCHGGTIGAIMESSFPNQQEHFFKWVPDPGHGYTLILEQGEIAGYKRLI